MPSFSVILPTYNGAAYLREAIDSVLSQSFKDFELLIRDDGSKDKTVEIIESYQDPRIHLLKSTERLGLFANLNSLMKESKAPLVRIFCQDDILEPKCLEREKEFFQIHPEIGMSYCKSQSINALGVTKSQVLVIDLPSVIQPELSIQHFFYHGCIPGNLSTVCLRKEVYDQWGPFNATLKVSGDYELWSRICAHRPLGIIHEALVRLRQHEERLSNQSDSVAQFINENKEIRKSLIPLLPISRQKEAIRFQTRRHQVLDFHQGIHALKKRNWKVAKQVFSSFGFFDFFQTAFYWLLTGNNHFYRPQANWVLPADYELV